MYLATPLAGARGWDLAVATELDIDPLEDKTAARQLILTAGGPGNLLSGSGTDKRVVRIAPTRARPSCCFATPTTS